jgi:hypothetical protein
MAGSGALLVCEVNGGCNTPVASGDEIENRGSTATYWSKKSWTRSKAASTTRCRKLTDPFDLVIRRRK